MEKRQRTPGENIQKELMKKNFTNKNKQEKAIDYNTMITEDFNTEKYSNTKNLK